MLLLTLHYSVAFSICCKLQYLAGSFTDENILEAQPEKVCAAVALLRRAAVQFAATLDQVRYHNHIQLNAHTGQLVQ
jgi:hypothetical protein